MNNKNKIVKTIIFLNILMFMGCQNTKTSSPPKFLTDPKACSLVINQNFKFENKGFEDIWFSATLKVVNSLVMTLNKNDYKSLSKISEPSGKRLTIEKINHDMILNKCSKIIKVIHVKENPTEFGFDIEILEPDILHNNGDTYLLKATYYKKYRFPLTKETFDTLSLPSVGQLAAEDIISNWKHLKNATDDMSARGLKHSGRDIVSETWELNNNKSFLDKKEVKPINIRVQDAGKI